MAQTPFTISAPPSTDVWRKPPSTNAFNAPSAKTSTGPLKSFIAAKISFSLPADADLIQYDQGGILLSLTKGSSEPEKSQWLKSGIEYYNSKPYVGTVSCDRWADWSIVPMDTRNSKGGPTVTIELERSKDELGSSLWLYVLSAQGERLPIREVTWVFAEQEGVELAVSAYAARPQKPSTGPQELEVSFQHFEVQWK